MMMARDVAPLSCAKLEKTWKAVTLKKPATMMWTYWPRGTFRSWRVSKAAANNTAAPMLEPATRRLQGDSSRSATAAAIQLKPHAKASSTTSSLAVAATSKLLEGVRDIQRTKRYRARPRLARHPRHANTPLAA